MSIEHHKESLVKSAERLLRERSRIVEHLGEFSWCGALKDPDFATAHFDFLQEVSETHHPLCMYEYDDCCDMALVIVDGEDTGYRSEDTLVEVIDQQGNTEGLLAVCDSIYELNSNLSHLVHED